MYRVLAINEVIDVKILDSLVRFHIQIILEKKMIDRYLKLGKLVYILKYLLLSLIFFL